VSPVFGKEISMFPLIIVLAATALKDVYEDYTRHKSDNETNSRRCQVFEDQKGLPPFHTHSRARAH